MRQYGLKAVAATLCFLLAGCAGQTAEPASVDQGGRENKAIAEQTGAVDTEVEEPFDWAAVNAPENADPVYEDPNSLPAYSYPSGEDYLDIISDYLIADSKSYQMHDSAEVYIPFSIVVEKDERNPDDIVVYGSYNIVGYELLNTTLVANYGSYGNGAFHIKRNADGTCEVLRADLPMVSEEEEEVFAPVDGLYERILALSEDDRRQAREQAIADYINTNGLSITQWQDYGKAPVSVLNAPPTPEEAQLYIYRSAQGYEMTYDLREYSLAKTGEDDMLGKVEDAYTGTFLTVKKIKGTDADGALKEVAAPAGVTEPAVSDATIGKEACRRAEWNEELEDGRIFRYIGYAVPTDGGALTVLLETTYEQGVSELSTEDLEREFEGVLASFGM